MILPSDKRGSAAGRLSTWREPFPPVIIASMANQQTGAFPEWGSYADEGISPDVAPKLGEVIRAKADIVEKPKLKPSH